MKMSVRDRFYEKVKINQGEFSCWTWMASGSATGYGAFSIRVNDIQRPIGAHRAAWIIENGPIPEGKHVLHKCHNPSCVRVDHLYLGSALDNLMDQIKSGRYVRMIDRVGRTDEKRILYHLIPKDPHRRRPARDLFYRHVGAPLPNGCWPWNGGRIPKTGHGRFNVIKKNGKKSPSPAHRVSWELTNGPIPEGMLVLHKCNNSWCVNPSHLYIGTYADNARDTVAAGHSKAHGFIGEAHPMAKLSDKDVLDIRSQKITEYGKVGYRKRELSNKYGVCDGTIKDIWYRRSWKHIPE